MTPSSNELLGSVIVLFILRTPFLLTIVLFFLLNSSLTLIVQAQDLPSAEGEIAYVGDDGNIYVYDFSNQETYNISDDATPNRQYQFPTWANDGRLAYFCCDLAVANSPTTSAHISDGTNIGRLVFQDDLRPIIYASWSPLTCSLDSSCLDLAMLVNNSRQGNLSVQVIRDRQTSESQREIATGAPFYYHWNSNGDQLVFYRNNQRIEIYDVAREEITANLTDDIPANFQAPAWSPIDNRIAFATLNPENNTTDLIIWENNETITIPTNASGLMAFTWSPNGQYIAYRVLSNDSNGFITVIDVNSGDTVYQSRVNNAISFFWSPDSQKIAFLSFNSVETFSAQAINLISNPIPIQEQPELALSMMDVQLGIESTLTEFVPSSGMIYLMTYFDQFYPSHPIWSPDNKYIVYSEWNDSQISAINVIEVDAVNPQPIQIDNGTFATWSFD